jgi:hypothetical protein
MMPITRENIDYHCRRYCNAIMLDNAQVAIDVMRKRPAAVAMMKRNDAVAGCGSWDNKLLFISATVMYFDSLCWVPL